MRFAERIGSREQIAGWLVAAEGGADFAVSSACRNPVHIRAGGQRLTLCGSERTAGGLQIQFRGLLYNRQQLVGEIGTDLQECGDAELFAEAYRRWGEEAFGRIEGVFAVSLYDPQRNRLYLIRDYTGLQPLYYYHVGKIFAFAHSLEGLRRIVSADRIDPQAVANYFTFGFILQPNTIYRQCRKLLSGHFLRYDIAQSRMTDIAYWDLGNCYDAEKYPPDEAAHIEQAEALLQASIQKRLYGSDQAALLLSGGYDSATIAALLQREGVRLKSYTIGFEESSIDEAPHARAIAEYLGIEHTDYYFTGRDALEIVPRLGEVYEEPFYDDGSIPTLKLSQMIASGASMPVFCGDGGDEVFATADDLERFRRILQVPYPLRKFAGATLGRIELEHVPFVSRIDNWPTKYYKMVHIFAAQDVPQMVRTKMTLFHPAQLHALLHHIPDGFPSRFDDIRFGRYAQTADKITGSYFQTFMLDGELVKTARAFDMPGFAVREPFLDRALVAYMARVDAGIKIKNGIKKSILKQIAHRYIPRKLLDRPKHGFEIPSSAWMHGILKEMLSDLLSEEGLRQDPFLDAAYVLRLRDDFWRGKEANRYKLWSIFLYRLWYLKKFPRGSDGL